MVISQFSRLLPGSMHLLHIVVYPICYCPVFRSIICSDFLWVLLLLGSWLAHVRSVVFSVFINYQNACPRLVFPDCTSATPELRPAAHVSHGLILQLVKYIHGLDSLGGSLCLMYCTCILSMNLNGELSGVLDQVSQND